MLAGEATLNSGKWEGCYPQELDNEELEVAHKWSGWSLEDRYLITSEQKRRRWISQREYQRVWGRAVRG
jgi:hypothetical protein